MAKSNVWRLRQIILEPELVEKLYEWHGGQNSYVYALASTGNNDLVSLSMIDGALAELRADVPKAGRHKRELKKLLGDLDAVRGYWREATAKAAGMEDHDSGLDRRDYGYEGTA